MGIFSRDIPSEEEIKDPELLEKLNDATQRAEDRIPWWKK